MTSVFMVASDLASGGLPVWNVVDGVVVRASWAYSDLMPIVTAFGLRVGLSPLLQWIVVPTVAFIITKRLSERYSPEGA
jgi:hypothetical protein